MSKPPAASHPISRCWRGALVALALLAPAALPAATASAASPRALAATHSCSLTRNGHQEPKYPGLGYFTYLSVSGTSCSNGDKLIVAYYHCRLKHGASGTCHSTVLGYTCHEKRESIPTEIDARVTCKRDSATIVHNFQQDT